MSIKKGFISPFKGIKCKTWEYDSEYFNTGDNIECDFDANSEIMIVYNCQAEEGNYLSQDNKYLYLRNANFKIKN